MLVSEVSHAYIGMYLWAIKQSVLQSERAGGILAHVDGQVKVRGRVHYSTVCMHDVMWKLLKLLSMVLDDYVTM